MRVVGVSWPASSLPGVPRRQMVAGGVRLHAPGGQPLARAELQIVYGTLYRRIPGLRLAVPLEQIPFKHDSNIYGVYELPVTF